jgi:polyphosphate kinase
VATLKKPSNAAPAFAGFKRPEERFFNRELSWLAFNTRVLEEAQNTNNPLLERVKFLSISASNLDEFYMVRVAGLKDQVQDGLRQESQDGLTAAEQLEQIYNATRDLLAVQQQCWQDLKLLLKKEDVHVLSREKLTQKDMEWLNGYFYSHIFPALSPIAIDSAHPFPFLPNLGMAVVMGLERRGKETIVKSGKKHKVSHTLKMVGKKLRAIIPLPPKLPRFVALPAKGQQVRLVRIEQIIELFYEELFPNYNLTSNGIIRIIRDSDLETQDGAEDLVRYYESALKRRRMGQIIRLAISDTTPENLQEFLIKEMHVATEDVVRVSGMLGLASISELLSIELPELRFPPLNIRFPERIKDYNGDCFAAIQAKDIVVHHPYESFDVVVQFLRQAASDPNVVAIKQTLYRTSNDSPIVKALIEAAEAGKSVTAMVELKARFDEEANIRWARDLERAGAQVVYGLVGLKTHCKVSLVVRKVESGLQSYVHFGTGNYHPVTAKFYTDLSFFTCDPALCRDAAHLFNYLTGYAPPKKFEKIAIAPISMRKRLLKLIEEEKEYAKAGKPSAIWLKMNSLVDAEMIDALYEAGQAGVHIDLIVRGICCLKPGIKGFSENIHVKSIVGRFLEHSRIFCFGGGHVLPSPQAKVYIASADWMPRNLSGRVEVMVPIENPTVHEQIMGQIMGANLNDERQSWDLKPDGSYMRHTNDQTSFSAHNFFITNPSLSGRGKALLKEKLSGKQ